MHRHLLKSVLALATAALPLTAITVSSAAAQGVSQPASDLALSIGRGQLITVPGNMADVFVANETVADVQIKSQRQLYVFAKAGGETTIYASNSAGDIIWSSTVRVGTNISSVDQMLTLAMPEAKISVATMGSNTVLLTGSVAAPEDAAEAERLVKAYMGETANVISRLRVATPLQVNLQVKIAEVSRSLIRSLGLNLSSMDGTGGFQFGIGQGRPFAPIIAPGLPMGIGNTVTVRLPDGTEIPGTTINPISPGTTIAGVGKFLGLDLAGALDLAERDGLVTTLSQPNLTALSGETAEFLAGGEFPIPMSQGLGTTTIEYKQYGVSLAYTPTVLSNGRISIRVRPEVSELSNQGAVQFNGYQIPALTVRRAETTVELGSGQSFMIAGLLSNNAQNTIDKAPGAGDLPILGNLFRSTEFRKGETELVIMVTPYLVNPVNERDIRLPTDGFQTSTTADQIFLMNEHNGVSGAERPGPRSASEAANAEPASDAPAEAARPGFSFN